jgi:hypothetical protein
MRRHHSGVTTRSLILAVALVALNLAGVVATSKFYPRREIQTGGHGNGRGFENYKADSSIEIGSGNAETGYRLERVVRCLPPPSLLQVWSPVVACAAFTLLVPVVPGRRVFRGTSRTLRSRAMAAARWTTILAALIAMNVACFVYRPLPGDTIPEWSLLHRNWLALRKETGGERDVLESDIRTFVYKDDGSILGYEGRPGQMVSRPIVLKPPTWSALTMRSPVLLSGTITIVVVVYMSRRWWRPRVPGPTLR